MFDFIEDTVQKLKPSLTSIIILFFKLSRVMTQMLFQIFFSLSSVVQ